MPELTREALIEIFRKHHPHDLGSLKNYLSAEDYHPNEEKLLSLIDQLISEGVIKSSLGVANSFREYLFDIWSTWWFYASAIVASLEVFLVLSDSQTGIGLLFRMIFGLGLLGLIPGFLTSLLLFPGGQLPTLERVALSIFLSVLIAIGIGVILGLGPYFQASNNAIVLAVYVVLLDVAASYRTYNFSRTLR